MSNTCFCTMKVVAKSRDTLLRVGKIFREEDPEYALAYADDGFEMTAGPKETGDGLWEAVFEGAMRNSGARAFEPYGEEVVLPGGTARLASFPELCKKLGFGVEYWGKEGGCCFQEHFAMTAAGRLVANESLEWYEEWEDEDGNELDDPIESGGFGERYETFFSPKYIYGK